MRINNILCRSALSKHILHFFGEDDCLSAMRLAPGDDIASDFDSGSADPVRKSEVRIRKFVARRRPAFAELQPG